MTGRPDRRWPPSIARSLTRPWPSPALGERLGEVRALLDDHLATAALGSAGRALLGEAVEFVAVDLERSETGAVLHGEPHDGNRLSHKGNIVYLDLEAACTGPLEWDLAYFPSALSRRSGPLTTGPCVDVFVSA